MSFGKQSPGPGGFHRSSSTMMQPGASPPNMNFGRQAASATSFGPRGPKAKVPRFVDEYRPSSTLIDVVRLIPGKYPQEYLVGEGENVQCISQIQNFIRYVDHYDGYMRASAICSAGVWANWRDKREKCFGCDIYWETAERNSDGRFNSTRMSKQNKFAVSVFDYGKYHHVEQIDRATGAPRPNPKTGKPYMTWEKCTGELCVGCRDKRDTQAGSMRHWPLNYTQFEVVRQASINIGRSCSRCGTEDSIRSLAHTCGACGELIIDMSTTTLKLEEIRGLVENQFTCKCGTTGYLQEIFSCQQCEQRGHDGARADLWDVNLRVQVVLTGDNDTKTLQILGWSAPGGIPPEYVAKVKPIPLLDRYAPDSLEEQAKRFGVGQGQTQVPAEDQPVRQPVTHSIGYQNPYGGQQK